MLSPPLRSSLFDNFRVRDALHNIPARPQISRRRLIPAHLRRIVSPLAIAILSVPICQARVLVVKSGDLANLASAMKRAKAGDAIRLSSGTYRLTEALAPPSGSILIGESRDRTILRYAGTKPSALIDLSNREGVRVSNLTLDANGDPNANPAIVAHHAARLGIDHVTIRNAPANGLGIHFVGDDPTKANGVTDSVISDCRMENMGVGSEWGGGIRLSWGSSRNRILRNVIRNTGRGGIFADNGSADLVIRGNAVSGSGGEGLGLEIWGNCDRCILEDNRLDHWLSISGSDQCAARRNVIGDGSGTVKFIGIEVIGSDEVLTDNVVNDGQQIGVSVSNDVAKDRVFWGYDRIENCVQWGAQLQGDKTGLNDHYFYRCAFDYNGSDAGKPIYPGDAGHGFRINANAHGIVFDHCDFSGNRGLGVQANGSDTSPTDQMRFIESRITNNRRAAASFWTGYRSLSWDDSVVKGNADNSLPPARGEKPKATSVAIFSPVVIHAGRAATFRIDGEFASAPGAAVLWDFDDGIPIKTKTAAHAFPHPGRYRVSLVVWNGEREAAHAEKTVKVVK